MEMHNIVSALSADARPGSVTLTAEEFAAVFPWLGPNDPVTVSLPADAFRRALQMALGGPEIMSTSQAAAVFGWSAKRWRGWAEGKRVAGAWQEKNGDWRLPRDGCRMLVAQMLRTRRTAPSPKTPSTALATKQAAVSVPSVITPTRSIRRGPRKKAA